MRPDPTLKDVQEQRRQAENDTACCINNDGSGCLQTKSDECAVRRLTAEAVRLFYYS